MKNLLTLTTLLLFVGTLNASMIRPFDDLGVLTSACDDVIIATVEKNLFELRDEFQNYSWQFNIHKSYKGNFSENEKLTIGAIGGASTRVSKVVYGEYHFEVGKTYMLFISKNEYEVWKPITLAYYNYEVQNLNNSEYLVPTLEALSSCTTLGSEPLFALNSSNMNTQLEAFIASNYQGNWKDKFVRADIPLENFYPELKAPPAHCTHLFGTAPSNCGGAVQGARWTGFPGSAVEMHMNTPVQSDKTNAFSLATNGINNMTANYGGINITDQGSVSTAFSPACTGGSALETDFQTYMSGVNSGRAILSIWDDPCSEIDDLVGCGGTLAVGGHFAFGCGSTHVHDGLDWRTAIYGYIIMNNGTGACQSDANFTIVLEHEYTHALSIGHVDPSFGTANMNPSCCNSIGALDISCLDYTYPPPGAVPVTWLGLDIDKRTTSNVISWQTATEVNNDFFEVQYSIDGTDFLTIHRTDGAGNKNDLSTYSFEDFDHLGTKSYYRIKQVDFDGQFSYSDVKSITRRKLETEVSLYPNPVNESLNIQTDLNNVDLRIVDALGKVYVANLSNLSDQNGVMDVSHLNPGVYFLEINRGSERSIHTFVRK